MKNYKTMMNLPPSLFHLIAGLFNVGRLVFGGKTR